MKKKISVFFALLFLMVSVMPLFLHGQKTKIANAETISFSEDTLKNKTDIISPERNSFSDSSATLDNSPFDQSKGKVMDGYTVTPNADEYGQVNSYYSIDEVNIKSNQSIYIWVYIPDTMLYDFSIILNSSAGKTLSFEILSSELYNIIISKMGISSIYGWKLFELPVKNATEKLKDETLKDFNFDSVRVKYVAPTNESKSKYSEKFSFYHIYVADSFYGETTIAEYCNYANYKVKDSFMSKMNNLYVGDSIKVMSSSEIFEYMYIGKNNVVKYPNLNLTWSLFVSNENGKSYEMKFGNSYTFDYKGYYTVGVKVYEKRSMLSNLVVNYSDAYYVEEFDFGSMKSEYTFKKGEENIIKFQFTPDFVLDGEVNVSISDKNIASESHYIKNNVLYITISAVKYGSVELKVSAKGYRQGETKLQDFEQIATIDITQDNTQTWEMWVLWITFGVFCACLLIFMVISFVKARKSGVK